MAKNRTLQLYRGTSAQNDAYTGSAGELTMDTTNNEIRVHDGSTAGGHAIYNKAEVDTALSGVVHLAGAETITGLKTIEDERFNLVQTSVTKGTNPSTTTYWAIQANDVSNSGTWADTRIGAVAWGLTPDGTSTAQLAATQNVAGSNEQAIVEAVIESNGTKYGRAPTPAASSSTSEEKIATTGWVNDATLSTNVVHRDTAEDISGIKTFTSSSFIIKKYGSKPDGSNHYLTTIESRDSDDNVVSYYRTWFDTSKSIHTDIMAHRIISGTDYYSTVGATVTSAGVEYGTAPASDVNGSIVTTVNKSKGQSGYFKLGNGLIVQWGRASCTVGTQKTVNLPTSFSGTISYGVTTAGISSTAGQQSQVVSQSSSSFVIIPANSSILWIAVGY